MNEVTRILHAIERGDVKATDELLPVVYEELRLLAAQKLAHESPGQTLQATALVHEAYLRLLGDEGQTWENRAHFFAAAAEAMRRILIDNARRKRRLKRGGGQEKVDLGDAEPATNGPDDDSDRVGRGPGEARPARQSQSRPGQAPVLRGPDRRAGGQGPGHLPQHGGPLLGLRPLLAAPGDRGEV